jgi:hypothetical protein
MLIEVGSNAVLSPSKPHEVATDLNTEAPCHGVKNFDAQKGKAVSVAGWKKAAQRLSIAPFIRRRRCIH